MRYAALLLIITLGGCATSSSHTFLSPIHEDIDKVCRFTPETLTVRDNIEKLGPALRPQIKTPEVSDILATLDREGGERLVLLAKSLGYPNCDLIEVLSERHDSRKN